jgi:hypothetical protein
MEKKRRKKEEKGKGGEMLQFTTLIILWLRGRQTVVGDW